MGIHTYLENVDFVATHLTSEEALAQLAEEASELAKAALKVNRTTSRLNPTPVTREEALENLLEEYADVQLVMEVIQRQIEIKRGPAFTQSPRLCKEVQDCRIHEVKYRKLPRWIDRLIRGGKND